MEIKATIRYHFISIREAKVKCEELEFLQVTFGSISLYSYSENSLAISIKVKDAHTLWRNLHMYKTVCYSIFYNSYQNKESVTFGFSLIPCHRLSEDIWVFSQLEKGFLFFVFFFYKNKTSLINVEFQIAPWRHPTNPNPIFIHLYFY